MDKKKEEISLHTKEVEQIIEKYLPKEEGFQKKVIEAMNYSFLAGGKRLRPMLMLETYRLFGGKGKVIEPFMAAIEMIHTYSLVHDDLPAMDNDAMPRVESQTTHEVYGEAMAILAGDGLLNYRLRDRSYWHSRWNRRTCGLEKRLRYLRKKQGSMEWWADRLWMSRQTKVRRSQEKNSILSTVLKTSALIEASMLVGAILAGASKEEQDIIAQVAGEIGLAFQIQDDVLDVTSTMEVLGKPIGSDEKNNKATYVTYEGLDKAKQDVERISVTAVERLSSLPEKNKFLEQLLLSLIQREK